jgi:hypothetical protein
MSGDFANSGDYYDLAILIWFVLLPFVGICKGLFGTTKRERERQRMASNFRRREREFKKELRRTKDPEERAEIEDAIDALKMERLDMEDRVAASKSSRQKKTLLGALVGGIIGGSM